MQLKAILICDDVRVELGGTLSIIGAYNERMVVRTGPGEAVDGEIELPRLVCLAVVAELDGHERVGFRQRIIQVGDPEDELPPFSHEPHNPAASEHNFVFGQAPMIFPRPGQYEVVIDVEAGAQRATYRYRFHLDRPTNKPQTAA